MHTEGHDLGKDTLGNTQPAAEAPKFDTNRPGYETTDVRVGGVVVFLVGLFATVIVFFFFCYGMGKVIDNLWIKQDGKPTKWSLAAGVAPAGRGESLASNPEIEQQQLRQVISNFPEPRLDIDDGLQATADLHAREDLLLNHYSTIDGQNGTIRIPIERAMQLIAQRGLPVVNAPANAQPTLAYAGKPELREALTTGFARTGFELTTIEEREQKVDFNNAQESGEGSKK